MQRPQTRTSWTTPLLTRRCRTAEIEADSTSMFSCRAGRPGQRTAGLRGVRELPRPSGDPTRHRHSHTSGAHTTPNGPSATLLHALRRTHRLVCSSCDRGLIPVGVKLHCRRLKDGGILVAYLLGRRCTRIDHQPQTNRDSSAHNQSYLEGGDCEIRTLSLKSCVHCT